MLGPNRVIAKGVKSCTCCCYVRCAILIEQVGGNALTPNRRTHYHAHLGLPDQGCAIKGLVVCFVVWLGSMVRSLALVVVRVANEPKYCNTPEILTYTYKTYASYRLGYKSPVGTVARRAGGRYKFCYINY